MHSAVIQHKSANDKSILGLFKIIGHTFTGLMITIHKAQTAARLAGNTLQNKEEILNIYTK